MIGVLIITHGKFAEGLLDSVHLIMGKQEKCEILSLHHGDSIEEFSQAIFEKMRKLDEGSGVIVVTDLYSASPYNQTALNHNRLLKEKIHYRLLSGVNLPMLLEIFNQRLMNKSLDTMTEKALNSAKKGVKEFFIELKKVH